MMQTDERVKRICWHKIMMFEMCIAINRRIQKPISVDTIYWRRRKKKICAYLAELLQKIVQSIELAFHNMQSTPWFSGKWQKEKHEKQNSL